MGVGLYQAALCHFVQLLWTEFLGAAEALRICSLLFYNEVVCCSLGVGNELLHQVEKFKYLEVLFTSE